MMMRSNTEWLEWGRRDPLQGVATWPGRERGSEAAWTDDDFYALGAAEWDDYARIWHQYGVMAEHCVEYGCGAGRMTRVLAGFFPRVTAVDISPDQLAYARSRLKAEHVVFSPTDGASIPLGDGSATAFFSTYVFQHFSSFDGARAVLAEAARVLAPGATILLQVPLCRFPQTRASRLLGWLHRAERALAGWKTDWQARRGRLVMRMRWYDRDWLAGELERLGFTELEFRSLRMTANGHWNDIVLARKK